jgi:hypothetical protein
MAAKIGILAESTTTTADSTITAYTVPADKAARIRILFIVEGGAGATGDYTVMIGTPGASDPSIQVDLAANEDCFTGVLYEAAPDPPLSMLSGVGGVQTGVDIWEDAFTTNLNLIITPLAADYFLSTGDTIRFYFRTGAPLKHILQVVGVEDDA